MHGGPVGRLDPIFKGGLPIREAQIVQETRERVRLRYVPAVGFDAATTDELKRRLRERLGPVEVVLEAMDTLPRSASGKLRGVICLHGKNPS